ncbi:homeobox-leucine zipper protein ROC5-like [Lycium barbarum]|uniref:homeobox-leucine zipper protein ROC5-like n=1 Tax=Lycium barbarum TaxID=112863 RepID=UPI00293E20E2|nr:homeobox-leucine zipper protein ROC5-like [Lycium barbarum]
MGERGESLDKVVIGVPRQDENESRLVGDNIDGDASGSFQPNRRKFNRHNANQIQQLEAYFKENPHPDEKARLQLGMKLSMDSNQVKSWFQNRRTQRKSQLERCKTRMLKEENDKLRMEHIALKKAMRNPTCDRCSQLDTIGGINVDEHKTNIEHDRLQDEVKRIKVLADKLLGPSAFFEGSMNSMMKNSALEFVAGRNEFSGINVVDTASPMGLDFENGLSSPLPVISPWPTTSLTIKDVNYDMSMIMDLAFASMNELLKLADTGEPLWVKSLNGSAETLNLHEYARLSTTFIDMKPGHFITEATRASGTVLTDSLTLVETLMDKSRWMETFSCIIGKTSTFDVISTGIGGSRSGTLLLIQTELQIISDLVPVRETKFLRFCQRHDVGWAIVDVSVDTIQKISEQCQIGNCRRLPSGCIVRDMPSGYSQVTWIEHVEYNENLSIICTNLWSELA